MIQPQLHLGFKDDFLNISNVGEGIFNEILNGTITLDPLWQEYILCFPSLRIIDNDSGPSMKSLFYSKRSKKWLAHLQFADRPINFSKTGIVYS